MKNIYLCKSMHEIFIDRKTYDENPNISIRKVLGKENVHLNRQWTHKGGGNIITWYTVTNLDGAKKCAEENGYEIVIEDK